MTATTEKTPTNIPNDTAAKTATDPDHKIDRNAPAGSENSLGAQSVRDGRPSTCDDVVEAKDEASPGTD